MLRGRTRTAKNRCDPSSPQNTERSVRSCLHNALPICASLYRRPVCAMKRLPGTPPPPPNGPCRYCGDPAHITDDYGPVHLCCRAWRHVMSFGFSCPSCQVARIVAHTGRLPKWLPPLPLTLPDGSPYVPEVGPYVPEAGLEAVGARSDAA